MTNDVNELIKKLKSKGQKQGLSLYRYQSNKGAHAVTVTYAFHQGSRPAMSKSCSGPQTSMGQLEGTTKRCEAYRELSDLLSRV